MMARKKQKKHKTRMVIITEGNLPEPLENLRLRLLSPRLRAPGTIKTYLETAQRFLMWVDGDKPTDNDLRKYFMKRRQHGISERTLKKEFFHLKKLYQSNQAWPEWPFQSDDTPYPEEKPYAPALELDEIELLIRAKKKLTERERFYLAAATVWGCRRIQLAKIRRRDYDDEKIVIRPAHKGYPVEHLIPDELKGIFNAYNAREHEDEALSGIFKRICKKAGLKPKPRVGWHSIRRTLDTIIPPLLIRNRIDGSIYADYVGWAASTKGSKFRGADMAGIYDHPEILYEPFGIDKIIYKYHPFLPLWADKELTKPTTERRKHAKIASRTSR